MTLQFHSATNLVVSLVIHHYVIVDCHAQMLVSLTTICQSIDHNELTVDRL